MCLWDTNSWKFNASGGIIINQSGNGYRIILNTILFLSKWNEDSMKSAIKIIKNVFIVWILIFLFLVIVYDLITNIPWVIK